MIREILRDRKNVLFRFVTVGSLSTIINVLVFIILIQLLDLHYILSASISYICGFCLGFILNTKFLAEFQRFEIRKYLIVYSISLLIQLLFMFSMVIMGLEVFIAFLVSLFLGSLTNFLGIKYFVFAKTAFIKKINYLVFRFRYFIIYVVIGLTSILVELLVIASIENLFSTLYLKLFLGFMVGMIFSFVLNLKLNFDIPKEKSLRTFRLFVFISFCAFIINLLLIKQVFPLFGFVNYNYIPLRFISAGLLFMITYTLHRRFTFRDVKQVGIAIYLSDSEDIGLIYSKVSIYPDFLHIDLVDKTFNKNAAEIDVTKGADINQYWPYTKKMTHIMSRTPSHWIDKVAYFSDYIIIHSEIDEDVGKLIAQIKSRGKKAGISIMYKTPIASIMPFLKEVDLVQILAIEKPGFSNQHLQKKALTRLHQLTLLRDKYNFEICFDGGLKPTNIHKINAKYIVSGSAVLNSKNVIETIHTMKTSGRYYFNKDEDLKAFLAKSILDTLNAIEFVKSGTIVGSFVDKPGIEGLSDVDIVVIVDKLNKSKFEHILTRFKELKPVIELNFDKKVLINTCFGPLKFNVGDNIVLHLMVYDIEGHKLHCLMSPFTCYDWQRSDTFVKKHMSELYAICGLSVSDFFNSRRSINDYIKDIEARRISYRKYTFDDNGALSEKIKYKTMNNKDIFEFFKKDMQSR